MKKIFVALSTFAQEASEPLQLLQRSGFDFAINPTGKRLTKEDLIKNLGAFDGVVAGLEPYDAQVLSALPRLSCISRCGVGIDNVDLMMAKQKGVTVLNTPDVVVEPVAELTLALILDLLRQVSAHNALMHQKKWQRLTGMQLAGKKVGVIGLGRIGRRVAQLLHKLDAKIYGYDPVPDPAWAQTNGVRMTPFYELLKECDIITLHLSPTPEYPFCLGEEDLAKMKKGAFLVNVARGSLVDEQAMVKALKQGTLAGAALDVYAEEPYDGPLCDLPNVVLTPHVATLTAESRSVMEAQAVHNIIRFFKESKV